MSNEIEIGEFERALHGLSVVTTQTLTYAVDYIVEAGQQTDLSADETAAINRLVAARTEFHQARAALVSAWCARLMSRGGVIPLWLAQAKADVDAAKKR